MKTNKQIMLSALTLGLILGCTGCANKAVQDDTSKTKDDSNMIKIVCETFPQYDWTRNVLDGTGIDYKLYLLQDGSVDLHSYSPSAEDIVEITNSDLFIYNGGESDEWAEELLSEPENKDLKTINLLEALGEKAKVEEAIEGVPEEEHEGGEEEVELDEHVWLSLKNAQIFTEAISTALTELDPANAKTYEANSEDYLGKLTELDAKYVDMVDNADMHTIIVADRFPFRYLADDYGLNYYAAFSGCSAETEASFETVTFLTEKCKELNPPTVIITETGTDDLANSIKPGANIGILNAMQAKVSSDSSYLDIMESNYNTLEQALNTGLEVK